MFGALLLPVSFPPFPAETSTPTGVEGVKQSGPEIRWEFDTGG
jgi:hypothetical protein